MVEARYYDDIADMLLRGAKRVLQDARRRVRCRHGAGRAGNPRRDHDRAHGAAAREQPYDGVVALGCVIRGETSHYDIVAGESARAIMDISIALDMPVGNGILTVDTDAQARARARPTGEDKGGGAARAALTLVRLKRSLVRGRAAMTAPTREDRKANRRGAARLAAVQALYQMDIAATPLNDILAEFESHWIGREVEGSQYLPAEAAFFRSVVRGVLDDQRTLDPMIDKALQGGWPLEAGRGAAARRAARRARSSFPRAPTCRRASSSPSMSTSRTRSSTATRPAWSTAVLDQLARQLRAAEFGRAAG